MRTSDIIRQGEIYSEHVGITLFTIGSYAVKDGKFFARLIKGGDCTLTTASNLVQWFSDNWPADLTWPAHIPRPTPTKEVA